MGGRDAERDDAPRGRSLCGVATGLVKFVGVTNHMVGGQHEDQRVTIAFRCEHGRLPQRRAGIAAARLQHDVGLYALFAQLLSDDEAKVGIGDDDRP